MEMFFIILGCFISLIFLAVSIIFRIWDFGLKHRIWRIELKDANNGGLLVRIENRNKLLPIGIRNATIYSGNWEISANDEDIVDQHFYIDGGKTKDLYLTFGYHSELTKNRFRTGKGRMIVIDTTGHKSETTFNWKYDGLLYERKEENNPNLRKGFRRLTLVLSIVAGFVSLFFAQRIGSVIFHTCFAPSTMDFSDSINYYGRHIMTMDIPLWMNIVSYPLTFILGMAYTWMLYFFFSTTLQPWVMGLKSILDFIVEGFKGENT